MKKSVGKKERELKRLAEAVSREFVLRILPSGRRCLLVLYLRISFRKAQDYCGLIVFRHDFCGEYLPDERSYPRFKAAIEKHLFHALRMTNEEFYWYISLHTQKLRTVRRLSKLLDVGQVGCDIEWEFGSVLRISARLFEIDEFTDMTANIVAA